MWNYSYLDTLKKKYTKTNKLKKRKKKNTPSTYRPDKKQKTRRPDSVIQLSTALGDGAKILPILQTNKFDYYMNKAYESKDGYIIAMYNGEKSMFIAGTGGRGFFHDMNENITELTLQIKYGPSRMYPIDEDQKQEGFRLSAIAREYNPTMIYGHSRGAAYMSHMSYKNGNYIALDGAMAIATGPNKKNILNIHRHQTMSNRYFETLSFIKSKEVDSKVQAKATDTAAGIIGETAAKVASDALLAKGVYDIGDRVGHLNADDVLNWPGVVNTEPFRDYAIPVDDVETAHNAWQTAATREPTKREREYFDNDILSNKKFKDDGNHLKK